jgi:tRNA (Thr-GGU) A37 N-methylase
MQGHDRLPLQAPGASGIAGTMAHAPASITGLRELEGGSHLLLVYHVHLVQGVGLPVTPCVDNHVHGSVCVAFTPQLSGGSSIRQSGMIQTL